MTRRKQAGILSAALVLLLLSAVPKTAHGADGIDTTRKCSVTFCLTNLKTGTGGEASGPEYTDLTGGKTEEEKPVSVRLYKVADVTPYGTYRILDSYKGTDGSEDFKSLLSGVHTGTAQPDWKQMAKLAAQMTGVDPEPAEYPEADEMQDMDRETGSVTFTNLEQGLYLAAASSTRSPEYDYHFTPYLISLPDNRYEPGGRDDAWIYDLTGNDAVGLKAAWEARYADLVIQKTLDSYDRTLGEVSCVFQIEAKKNGIVCYSDVASLKFDGSTLSRSVVISGKKIPAESEVTVTEVYAGAGYQLQGTSGVRELTVTAAGPNTAAFVNEYREGSLKGGSSVVNHFVNQGTADQAVWDNEKLADSTVESVKGGRNREAE